MLVDVPLQPYLEEYIRQAVASGQYRSPERLIEYAVFLLAERDRNTVERIDTLIRELRAGKQAANSPMGRLHDTTFLQAPATTTP
jgi:Arc/MetJ-type ribon-helix-helix transcriptional regulator